MYLVVPQLKNRQIELNMAVFYPLADDCATSRSCHFNNTHEDPHKTFFCTPHDAGVVKDAKF